jgi:hypothetical protein
VYAVSLKLACEYDWSYLSVTSVYLNMSCDSLNTIRASLYLYSM